MPFYESVFITRQDISPQQVEGLTESFAGVIREGGGEVGRTEYWGLRSLAYRIKKNRKGHYVLMNLNAPADALHEMERRMRLDEDIIRFMTVKVDKLEEGPSIMLQTRTAREGSRRDFPRDRDRDRGDRDRDRDRGDRDRDRDRGRERGRAEEGASRSADSGGES